MGYVSDQISCGCGQQCGGGPQQGGGEFQPNWATVTATSGGLYHIEAREAIPTPRWSNLALNRAPTNLINNHSVRTCNPAAWIPTLHRLATKPQQHSDQFLIIQNLDNKILIGTDFMKTMGITLDMKNSKIVFPDRIAENMKAEEEEKIFNKLKDKFVYKYPIKYAIKDVQECISSIRISDSSIFSTLDMTSGFWQQHLDDYRYYTAFAVPFLNTQFRWSCTTMGLQGAPASFSRVTGLVFRGIANVITYINQ